MWLAQEGRLCIAIQKSGRLAESCQELFKKCGLELSGSKDDLICRVTGLPLDLLRIRDDDIPAFVGDGICNMGIVGENVFAETQLGRKNFSAEIIARLGFSNCRLSLAVPEAMFYERPADLEGKTIATSYPNLLRDYLTRNDVKAKIVEMGGSVEVAPRIGMADAIADIVASGGTLAANNLRECDVILNSEAVLIGSGKPFSPVQQNVVDRLLKRTRGVQRARESKYVALNAPRNYLPQIVELLPGADAPTVTPLVGRSGWVAVQAVCREGIFWDTLEELEKAGASSILVMPIEKMLPGKAVVAEQAEPNRSNIFYGNSVNGKPYVRIGADIGLRS